MRRTPILVCALVLPGALSAPPALAGAGPGTGGTSAPSFAGGVAAGQPVRAVRRFIAPPQRPRATEFRIAPAVLAAGAPVSFTLRVDAAAPRVRVRVALARIAPAARTVVVRLGYVPTGRRLARAWTPAAGELPGGEWVAALQAFDDAGRGLLRTARASGRGRLTVAVAPPPAGAVGGVFPVRGPYDFGGPDARFGATRTGHIHQGQDVMAPEGTPLVSPVAGSVFWSAFQRGGAGYYVVVRGADGRDYVFMHLREGSVAVARGAPVAPGTVLGQVGATGRAAGSHLHFEIWPDGWYSSRESAPIDPLPQLLAWAGAR